jgi:hypothetical protein
MKAIPILDGAGLCKCKRCGEIISDEERKENKGRCDTCYYTCSICGAALDPRERSRGKCFSCDEEVAGDNDPVVGFNGDEE